MNVQGQWYGTGPVDHNGSFVGADDDNAIEGFATFPPFAGPTPANEEQVSFCSCLQPYIDRLYIQVSCMQYLRHIYSSLLAMRIGAVCLRLALCCYHSSASKEASVDIQCTDR